MTYRYRPTLAGWVLLSGRVLGGAFAALDSAGLFGEFLPQEIHVGDQLGIRAQGNISFQLTSEAPLVTVDYGIERAGYPFFSVSELSEPAQVEVKYSETLDGLNEAWSDGPYTFATGLSNSFRVETFNITSIGRFDSSLIQGGQRWQSLHLIAGASITFDQVGFEATVNTTDADNFPGQFDSTDDDLNAISKLGAVAASLACVESGTQGAVWTVDPIEGAFVHSLRPSQSIYGTSFTNYTLRFETKIERAGVWWAVAYPLGASNGIHLQLVSELPEASTFANVNHSLTPANSVLLSYGYDFVNETTLTSYYLDTFSVPFPVTEQTWHEVETVMSADGRLSLLLDGVLILNVSMSDYWTPSAVSFAGSFGFGAYQDQAAYIKNVEVSDSANVTVLYSNSMTSDDILTEFGTRTNPVSVCLDGPKRDRLVWLGDLYHTMRIIPVSTSRLDLAKGTFELLLQSQLADGELNMAAPMSYDATITAPFLTPFGFYALQDYQLLGISSFYSYIRASNDLDFLTETWSSWSLLIDWITSKIDSETGLVTLVIAFLGGASGGSAVSCAAVQALFELADLANAIGKETDANRALAAANTLSEAINNQLWNSELGVYSLSMTSPGDFSVAGTSFCITSGVANEMQAASSITALKSLALNPGFKDATTVYSSSPTAVISPNTNGFLLEALFQSNATTEGLALIRSLWSPMIDREEYNSGASWEYVTQDGAPGLGGFTSLAHPWGGAPTYILTEWVAGLRAAPGLPGFGYQSWIVDPSVGASLGLTRASARLETPTGVLSVEWELVSNELRVAIEAPPATYGTLQFNGETRKLCGKVHYDIIL